MPSYPNQPSTRRHIDKSQPGTPDCETKPGKNIRHTTGKNQVHPNFRPPNFYLIVEYIRKQSTGHIWIISFLLVLGNLQLFSDTCVMHYNPCDWSSLPSHSGWNVNVTRRTDNGRKRAHIVTAKWAHSSRANRVFTNLKKCVDVACGTKILQADKTALKRP